MIKVYIDCDGQLDEMEMIIHKLRRKTFFLNHILVARWLQLKIKAIKKWVNNSKAIRVSINHEDVVINLVLGSALLALH